MPNSKTLLKNLDAALEELEESDFDDAWPAVERARDALAKPAHAALAKDVKKRMYEDDVNYLVWEPTSSPACSAPMASTTSSRSLPPASPTTV